MEKFMRTSIEIFQIILQSGSFICCMLFGIGCLEEGLAQFDFREDAEDAEDAEDGEEDAPAEFGKHVIRPLDEISDIVYSADLDKDGDTDFIAFTKHSFRDNQIVWYENRSTEADGLSDYVAGGAQNDTNRYFKEHLIVRLPELIYSVSAGDLDGDGDVDVAMAASEWVQGDSGLQQKHRMVWYENAGAEIGKGTANDFAEHVIGDDIQCCLSDIQIADMDADGDMDVVFAEVRHSLDGTNSKLGWYENVGLNVGLNVGENTAGEFEKHDLGSAEGSIRNLDVHDIDGDGDLDLFGIRFWQQEIVWYENKGINADLNSSLELTEHVIGFQYYKPSHIQAADMDGDGDSDFLVALDGAYPDRDSYIGWLENPGTELGEDSVGDFLGHTIRIIYQKTLLSVYSKDVDGDGDMDVFSNMTAGFSWYENTGMNVGENSIDEFVEHIEENDMVYAARSVPDDLDGDGDVDVFSISREDGITWFEKF
jgi:hypothetical protein